MSIYDLSHKTLITRVQEGETEHSFNLSISTGSTLGIWQGTQEEFDAIPVKDPSIIYLIEVEL